MDAELQKKFDLLASLTLIPDGENPILHLNDALRLGARTEVIQNLDTNGDYYEIRWTGDPVVPEVLHRSQICDAVVDRVIKKLSEDKPEEANVVMEPVELKCPTCGKVFKTVAGLDKHVLNKH